MSFTEVRVRRFDGTTLLETLIACTIVVLVLLSLLGAIAFGLEGIRHAEGHQQGVYHAREILELIRERQWAFRPYSLGAVEAVGFLDEVDARVPLNGPPFQDDLPEGTGYSRRIVTEQLSFDPGDHRSKVYRVEVTVFWTVKGRENSFRVEGLNRALW